MKLKLSLDKAVVQRFFLEHAEKIVFGGIALCGLLILYSAYRNGAGKAPLGTPAELKASADNTKLYVQKDRTDEVRKGLKIEDYPTVAGWSRQPVQEDAYKWLVPLSPPIGKADVRREAPPLLAVRHLTAQADRGGLLLSRTGGAGVPGAEASPVAGQRWVLLTGLAPIREQFEAYYEKLGKAAYYEPTTDVPDWKWFVVERAEAPAGGTAGELKYEPLDLRNAVLKLAQFSPQADAYPELVVNKRLALPLPIRADKPWGDEVYPEQYTGPRYAKVRANPASYKAQPVIWTTEASREVPNKPRVIYIRRPFGARSAPAEYFAIDFPNADTMRAAQRPGPVAAIVAGGNTTESVIDEITRAPQSTSMPLLKVELEKGPGAPRPSGVIDPDDPLAHLAGAGNMGGGEGGGGGAVAMAHEGGGMAEGGGAQMMRQAKWALFRFMDLDVKPGRTYVYRVKLVLANPNYRRPAAQLKDAKDALRPNAETAYTDPTEAVTIPSDTHLLATEAKPPAKPGLEALTKVAVVRWLETNGTEAHREFPTWRGAVLNFPEYDFPPTQPVVKPKPGKKPPAGGHGEEGGGPPPRAHGGRGGAGEEGGEGGGAGGPAAPAPVQVKVNYSTGAMVLDMYPADKPTNPLGEVLVLDTAGKLRVYNVVDGKAEFDTRQEDLRRRQETPAVEGGGGGMGVEGGGGLEFGT